MTGLTTRLSHNARKIYMASPGEARVRMLHTFCDAGHLMIAALDRNTLPAVKILWDYGADIGEARHILRPHFRVVKRTGPATQLTYTLAHKRSVKTAVAIADKRKSPQADVSDLLVGILMSDSPSVNQMISRWNLPVVTVIRALHREQALTMRR